MDSSTSAGSNQVMDFTIAHLVLIAVIAVLVIIGIWWGSRLARRRRQANRDLADAGRIDHVSGNEPVPEPDTPDLERSEPAPSAPPVSPPPPPLTASETVASAPPPPAPAPAPAPTPPTPAPAPVPAQEPETAPAPGASGDDLTTLKGVGPKVAARLTELGITSFAALAALSPEQAAGIDTEMGNFKGRMARDHWQEQAALLAADDRAGYEAKFGKLG